MRNIRILFTLIVSSLFTLACSASPDSTNHSKETLKAVNDSISELRKEVKALESRLSTFPDSKEMYDCTHATKRNAEEIDKLQSKLNKKRSIVAYAPALLSLVALILSIIVFVSVRKKKSGNGSGENHSANDINQRLKNLEVAINNRSTPNTNVGNLSALQAQVSSIKQQVSSFQQQLENAISTYNNGFEQVNQKIFNLENQAASNPAPLPGGAFKQCLYARGNNGDLLTSVSTSKEETSVFKIEVDASNNRGTLELVNFNQMKQQNCDSIVEPVGNCTIANASRCDLIEKGVCEKHGDLWTVVKPLKIRIS